MPKSRFEKIDPILEEWSSKYGLVIFKNYKDYDVRSTNVIDDSGVSYHIWVETSEIENNYFVKSNWDSGKKVNRQRLSKKWEKLCSIDELSQILDQAYLEVYSWIKENGNERTIK